MRANTTSCWCLALCAGAGATAADASGAIGRVVALGDEWSMSNQAYTDVGADAGRLVLNTAGFLVGPGAGGASGVGSVAVFSSHPRVGASNFVSSLTGAGYSVSKNPSAGYSLATMLNFDMVVVGGLLAGSVHPATDALVDYVNAGGNVLVIGGTGVYGNALNEAAQWNPFLAPFGMAFGDTYFPTVNTIPRNVVPTTNPVGAGVGEMLWGFGQTVHRLPAGNPLVDLIDADFHSFNGFGDEAVIGTFAVPAPGAGLLAAGLGLAALRRRRMGA